MAVNRDDMIGALLRMWDHVPAPGDEAFLADLVNEVHTYLARGGIKRPGDVEVDVACQAVGADQSRLDFNFGGKT